MTGSAEHDAETFKAQTRAQWDAAAQGWNDHGPQIRAWLRESTNMMLDLAGVREGAHVLDVAAGAGDQTLDAARRVGPCGRVVATDISPGVLEFAKRNAEAAGLRNVETFVADGEALGLAEASFDAAICRLGLMFFPDPARGLREMARALKAGGRACSVVFSGPKENPTVSVLIATALRHAGLPPRDPFAPGGLLSLGQPGRMAELFNEAGFRDVTNVALQAPFLLPRTADYVAFVRNSASPIHQILARLPEPAREEAWADMESQLEVFQTPTGWAGPNELIVTAGRR